MKKIIGIYTVVILFSIFLFSSCENEPDLDSVSYPYTEHGIEYLGFKSGLTSSSSDQAFGNGLNEVLQAYIASHPNTSDDFTFDGVTYEFTNLQSITGGVPNYVWDQFWNDIENYSYSIGSCWGFVYAQIPRKRGTGTAYVLYTIITYSSTYGNSEVLYMAVRGNVSPK